ncbi:protein TONSOKU isoform X2 [Momordica charantia]|uniref:Protein TONSOKU n=1 Tax=Momordica charantia TaxID=3673 RepID=A0A6J1BUA2_MOMCH|nr:protein TONSOKU isoform X2 [Momordica charantia]
MTRDGVQFDAAKRSYRNAKAEGNRHEEAKWANVIGNILKNRGEYVKALKWFRIDYDVSVKYLPQKHMLATCQSLGEVYLRLEHFKDALIYQKKHLELAKHANDLVEQQRANTQLGRTYHELFLKSDDDHFSVRNAKKYFKAAMELAKFLKDHPPRSGCSFLKEYVDAHNNLGMLEMDLDNLEEAKKILTKGLEICEEEEVDEDDDGRSRLHHNLGSVYMELRLWDQAKKHVEKDIIICKNIGHCQGEAKGYINLGELHYRVQKYDEAIHCYRKALHLAKSMEDEDALVRQIDQNINTVKEAIQVMVDLRKEEQNLKKLMREMATARGTPRERKCLLQQNASLDCLIEKSSTIFAWIQHLEFAKRKKRVASELCDKEKLSDSYLAIGESYQKLRIFTKSIKWYVKSWEAYKSIGNLEGQALAKINIGDVFDCDGKWTEALDAFEESYRISVEANLPSVQLSALENMHYSHMIRFDNVEEARRLQSQIDQLKETRKSDNETKYVAEDCCSETDTEANEALSDSASDDCCLSDTRKSCNSRLNSSKHLADLEEPNNAVTLTSPLKRLEKSPKIKSVDMNEFDASPSEISPKSLSKSAGSQQTTIGRKRVRVILSDDEGENETMDFSKSRPHFWQGEDSATSDDNKNRQHSRNPDTEIKEGSAIAGKHGSRSCEDIEESTGSYKHKSRITATQNDKDFGTRNADEIFPSDSAASGSKFEVDISENLLHKYNVSKSNSFEHGHCVTFKIDNELIPVGVALFGDKRSIESTKEELACMYYLQLPFEKRSEGLLPVIQHISCDGRILESLEFLKTSDHERNLLVEAVINGWVSKPLIKLYIEYCKELSETPNMKLLKKLYNLEASDDEIAVSDCDLQDLSISPLLNALNIQKAFAILDLSHNLLGNGTMEKVQQVFKESSQTHDLTLDLHCNRFGPTALFQICECPILFTRLEVLNISGNRLTDACGSYLSTILKNCKGLWSLNIERCSITSRTIQKVANALEVGAGLEKLYIGYNNSISGNALSSLLVKLASLNRFTTLSLSGLKLSKPVIEGLFQLVKVSGLSGLMLSGTGIGDDAALGITESFNGNEEFVKLDLAYCGLTSNCLTKFGGCTSLIQRIHELNFAGNAIMQEGCNAVSSLIANPQCGVKVLVLNKCQLGIAGVVQIIQAVAGNHCLEELNLADNVDLDKHAPQFNITEKESKEIIQLCRYISKPHGLTCPIKELDSAQQNLEEVNTESNQLEVADSEEPIREGAAASGVDDSCASSCQRKSASLDCQFLLELSTAIGMAKTLQLLDLSNNGFSPQETETLFGAWSTSRTGSAQRHIQDNIVHLLVEGTKCCVRPCCKKD